MKKKKIIVLHRNTSKSVLNHIVRFEYILRVVMYRLEVIKPHLRDDAFE